MTLKYLPNRRSLPPVNARRHTLWEGESIVNRVLTCITYTCDIEGVVLRIVPAKHAR